MMTNTGGFKLCIFVLLFSGILTARGQSDTLIQLFEVEVKAPAGKSVPASIVYKADSSAIAAYQYQPVPELLRKISPLMVKDYGPGTLSSVSLRGSSSSHTLVRWNGITLNAPQSGMYDLSLMQVFPGSEISVLSGGSSAFYGSGAIGGVIDYNNSPRFDSAKVLTIGGGVGSFGLMQQRARLHMAGKKIAWDISFSSESAQNDFTFINLARESHPYDTLKHANREVKSLSASAAWKIKPRLILEYHGWLNSTSRQIPPTMLENKSHAFQEDQAVRNLLALDFKRKNGHFTIKSCWSQDKLGYVDSLLKLDSRTTSNTGYLISERNLKLKTLTIDLGAQVRSDFIDNTNYKSGKADRSIFSGYFSLYKFLLKRTLAISLSGRQEVESRGESGLSGYLGIEKKWKGIISTKLGAGKVHRLPTLNDLYWVPGGNIDLKAETGWTVDGVASIKKSLRNLDFEFSAGAFSHLIDNWIIWVPGKAGVWSPENVRQVHSTGTELQANLKKIKGDFTYSLLAHYSFTESTITRSAIPGDGTEGKQLIYQPYNKGGGLITARYKAFSAFTGISVTGFSFAEATNNEYIEGYITMDAGVFLFSKWKRFKPVISVRVNNILNHSYQVIRWRPMPGRSFLVSLEIPVNLLKTKKQ